MPVVRMPDGKLVRFPDNMAREEIKSFVAEKYPDAYKTQQEETFDWSKVTPEMREQIAANNRDYDNQSYAGRIVKDAVTGAGEGIVSGLYNAANGATLGGAGWLDRKTGGNFTALDERLQRRADETGAGFFNKAAKLAAEIGGNVAGAGGAITKGLTKTGLKGMGLGLTDAAVQGGIYGTTSADNWADVPANAAFGAAGGVAFGAALGGTAGILGKFAGMFRKGGKNVKDAKAAMDYLRKELGDDAVNAMIKEARENNLSLAEVADQKALDIVQKARQQTPAARHTIADNLEKLENRNIDNSQNFIDDMFGKRSGYETVDDITEAAIEKTRPMYEEMEGMGDLALVKTETAPTAEQLASYPAEIAGTKIFDDKGNLLKLYHGTNKKFDVFERGHHRIRPDADGFFFTPRRDMADTYAKVIVDDAKDQYIKEVYLNIKNPYKANNYNEIAKADSKFINQLRKEGYDGIIYKPTDADGVYKPYREEYVAFEPEQIIPADKIDNVIKSKQDLINQLNTGNYADIPFGALPENVRQQVNQIRINNGVEPLQADMIIPANVVKKWSSNRLKQSYSPERVAQIADEVFHSSDVNVSGSKYSHIQKLLKDREGHSNDFVGFISQNPKTGDTVAKTIYETKRGSVGRYNPTSLQDNPAGSMRQSLLYEPLMDSNISPISRIVKENDVIADTIKGVKRSLSSLKKASDTDARVLLEARKVLSAQTKSPDGAVKMQAINALKDLDSVLKPLFGGKLEQANKIRGDAYKYEDAFKFGQKIFGGSMSPERFSKEFNKLTDFEKEAVELGLRDKLLGILQNRTNEDIGWNSVIPQAVQKKIRRVLGVDEGDRLINYANARYKAMQKRNIIRGGSTTATNQSLRDSANTAVRVLKEPTSTLGILAEKLPFNNARNRGIANIMTNPNVEVAERAFTEVANPQGWEAVYQALTNPKSSQAKYNAALAAYLSNGMLNY